MCKKKKMVSHQEADIFIHLPRLSKACSHSVGTLLCVLKRVSNTLRTCHHTVRGACVPCTCPVFCWHIHGWLVAGVKCRRAERLGGRVLLFAVALHQGGACRLQTHLQVGSLHHALQEREMNQKKVRDEWKREEYIWLPSSSHCEIELGYRQWNETKIKLIKWERPNEAVNK